MGNLLHAKSVYELIDGIEMNDREKAAARAQMHRADAIVDALWSVAGGISGWVRGALGKPAQRAAAQ
ncbi:MAG: hypothetical protein ABWY12_14590 [Burkholderiales bacterium]